MIKDLIRSLNALGFFIEGKLWLGILYATISSTLVLPVTFLVQLIFDNALSTGNFQLLIQLGLGAIVLLFFNGFLSIHSRNVILRITKRSIYKIRISLMNRLLQSSHSYYIQTDVSRLHKVAVYDTEKIDSLFNSFFSVIIPSVIICAFLVGVLFFIDWQMSLVFIILGIISLWIIGILGKASKESLSKFQSVFSVFHQHTLFVLEYYTLIKATSNQSKELARHDEILRKMSELNLKMIQRFTVANNLQELIFSISSIILLVVGGYQVIYHSLSLGSLVSFYFCLYLLKRYFNNINGGLTNVLEGNYSLSQYQNLFDEVSSEPYEGTKKIKLQGTIHIESITFSFPSKKVFNQFSFHLEPGKVILLKGPNGSGKSTLISLILGFFKPDEGKLLADRIPYEQIDMRHMRSQISVLFQDSLIFNGTILDNITYANTDVENKEIDKAIQAASLDEFIQALPQGKQTQVGEKGIKLSGGQRQKLALARCFLSKAQVIIMDEPTNHLDQKTISFFIEGLKNIEHRPALLLVSHDSELSALADAIYDL
jgi:ABC-type bacteriocin/lantibiotic exporter with double-glycine peptidase domain